MDLVARGVPLPLASIDNRRSLVHLDNLVDALIACATAPAAAGRTYLVSDGEEVSTPELVRRIARALGVPARLFPFPSRLLRLGAALLGRGAEARRLTASLQIDPSRIGRELNWRPPVNLAAGIAGTARWYRDSVMRLDTPI
jgi:nucleoside-diphosphate-sugar epimerase